MSHGFAAVMLVATVAAILAGCGGRSSSPSVASVAPAKSTTASSSNQSGSGFTLAEMYAAAHCMRTHGVPNYPNLITVNGKKTFGFLDSSGIDTSSPTYQAARKYCVVKYLHFTDTRTPAQKAQSNAQALKYSQCMRSHGATDYPDPDGAGAIDMPTYSYAYTPKVLSAQQECKPLFTGNFVTVTPSPPAPSG